MKMPNADLAVVDHEKIVDYLLNSTHRFGAAKARFFSEFGFRADSWEKLAASLKEHGLKHDVMMVRETGFGPRFAVDGELSTPDGRRPRVRTVWQIDTDQSVPRLITAHPLEA